MNFSTTTTTTLAEPGTAPDASDRFLLRRYSISPGQWEPFLEVWRRIVVVRERHGFRVLCAFADREANMFTWAIGYSGDIDAAAERYYADPERVALKTVERYVTEWQVTPVELVDPHGPVS